MQNFFKTGLLAAVLAALPAPAALAQQPDQTFPYAQLPTQVVGIAPPAGWRTAYFSLQGVVAELGELTPDADVTTWRNLIAYLTVATVTNQFVDDMDANLADVATHCAASAIFHVQPAAAATGEAWGQIVCLDRPGQTNAAADAPLQIYVFRTLRTPDATFRFWRAWRGQPAEVDAVLQTGGSRLRLSATPSSADLLAAFTPVMQALTERWSVELTRSLEVCDLNGAPCGTLNTSVADVSTYPILTRTHPTNLMAGLAALTGDNSDPQAAADYYRRSFGRDPPADANGVSFATVLTPSNHNFTSSRSGQAFALMMFTAGKSSGGLFGAAGDQPLAPSEAARMRAYLLKTIRLVSQAPSGPAYDRFRVDLWPNQ